MKNEIRNFQENFDPNDFSQSIDVAVFLMGQGITKASNLLKVSVLSYPCCSFFDGTWHHQGFKSSHGVGVVISIDTEKVLNAEVLSKDCSLCSKNVNADDEWKKNHFDSGRCEKNCDEPSTSIAVKAAKYLRLCPLSEGLRYTTVLCDGDSKTIANLERKKRLDIITDK